MGLKTTLSELILASTLVVSSAFAQDAQPQDAPKPAPVPQEKSPAPQAPAAPQIPEREPVQLFRLGAGIYLPAQYFNDSFVGARVNSGHGDQRSIRETLDGRMKLDDADVFLGTTGMTGSDSLVSGSPGIAGSDSATGSDTRREKYILAGAQALNALIVINYATRSNAGQSNGYTVLFDDPSIPARSDESVTENSSLDERVWSVRGAYKIEDKVIVSGAVFGNVRDSRDKVTTVDTLTGITNQVDTFVEQNDDRKSQYGFSLQGEWLVMEELSVGTSLWFVRGRETITTIDDFAGTSSAQTLNSGYTQPGLFVRGAYGIIAGSADVNVRLGKDSALPRTKVFGGADIAVALGPITLAGVVAKTADGNTVGGGYAAFGKLDPAAVSSFLNELRNTDFYESPLYSRSQWTVARNDGMEHLARAQSAGFLIGVSMVKRDGEDVLQTNMGIGFGKGILVSTTGYTNRSGDTQGANARLIWDLRRIFGLPVHVEAGYGFEALKNPSVRVTEYIVGVGIHF
jgi:hypothetical protein